MIAALFLAAAAAAGAAAPEDAAEPVKTQTIYNVAACPTGRAVRALTEARRLTERFTDPEAHKLFVLNLAAHGVPRHAHHAAPSYIAVVEERQGIEATDELIFQHFCSAVAEFSGYVRYVAAQGETSGDGPHGAEDGYRAAAAQTVDLTRYDATRCADPEVFATLDRAAQSRLYNPKPVVDPPGVHYLRAVMDSALLGITTYADRAARRHDGGESFAVFCRLVKEASAALLRAQQDYNDEVTGEQAERARESQSLGLEAIKEKGLQEEAEKARREQFE